MNKELIISKYPEFSESIFVVNNYGWTNDVLIADEHIIFRFPKNSESAENLKKEMFFLPKLKNLLSINIPDFKYFSEDSGSIFCGYEMIKGIFLEKDIFESLPHDEKIFLCNEIGIFLSELHSFPENILKNYFGEDSSELQFLKLKNELIKKAGFLFSEKEIKKIHIFFDSFINLMKKSNYKSSLIHGDLSSDHILYKNKRLSGVIDFGDMNYSDPAYDFTGLFLCFGEKYFKYILNFYSGITDDNFNKRIKKFYIPKIPIHSILYGLEINDTDLVKNSCKNFRITLENII